MSDKADEALKILADVVRHPAFKQEEIDRLKSQRLDGLRVALQQPGSLARFVTARVVFGAGAYGHAAGGTLETVQAISARPDRRALSESITSRGTPPSFWPATSPSKQGKAFAEKFFGDWKNERSCA